ncbi:branched-chain amino acid ABC transporter permease [Sneathiella sp. HT1-7]|jgi:branched-chain amino acid transport system permease protein|uniref:branched-chain amino acid ABC transporter permease n=1 Tax=Sneathiella sp. HT1-7 TaxID=2887192 RepID=UPI001D13F110|nr:branched-chain amino acid ABC transporter permease [Sneathiella sp. HT1-7]MCC3305257.1 branched-chain amino acid ABC transporter permease [Sneathiella sp. HT1-7]
MRNFVERHTFWAIVLLLVAVIFLWMIFAVWPDWLVDALGRKKTFVNTLLNGVTLGGLYFLVASGFTLIFGLMRNVNLAHGSMYLLGAYIGYEVADLTGNWFLGLAAAFISVAISGVLLQVLIFRRMANDDLRQTLVTIGISIIAADAMLAIWTGTTYQFSPPDWLFGAANLPIISVIKSSGAAVYIKYPVFRLVVLVIAVAVGISLWIFLNRTRIGMMIRAGVNDREMLAATGVNVQLVFVLVFAIGAGLAGFAGVIGGTALSVAPGEDIRYLLASLVVVIVGGLGSITGAAIGALIIGLAEQFGLAYFPTYGVVLTFLIMVVVLAVRPQGLMGGR